MAVVRCAQASPGRTIRRSWHLGTSLHPAERRIFQEKYGLRHGEVFTEAASCAWYGWRMEVDKTVDIPDTPSIPERCRGCETAVAIFRAGNLFAISCYVNGEAVGDQDAEAEARMRNMVAATALHDIAGYCPGPAKDQTCSWKA